MKESKRLLSWISLWVLLLTNTMTPFSYADVEGGDLVDVQEPATIEAPVEEIPSDETPSDDIPEVVNPVDDGDDQPVNIDPIEQPVESVDDIEPVEPTEPVEDIIEPVEPTEEVEPVEPVNPTDNNWWINGENPVDIEDSDKEEESEDKIEGEEKDIDDKLLELLEWMDNEDGELNIMEWDDASHWSVWSGFYDLDVKGADWKTLFTIMDRNLWATTTWYGDTDTAYGYYYKWWNNYWFDSSKSISPSTSTVDAGGYWPDNYYYSKTFIRSATWDSSSNLNLWWWEYISSWDYVRQWPCPSWYHVPTRAEWEFAIKLWCVKKMWTWENCRYWDDFWQDLLLPLAGQLKYNATTVTPQDRWNHWYYWASSAYSSLWRDDLRFYSSYIYTSIDYPGYVFPVRCFKNTTDIDIIYNPNWWTIEWEYPESARWWEFQEIELPEPRLDRNVFKWWYTTSDFQEGSKVTNKILVRSSDENVKLYADWEECWETQAYSWDLWICYNPENAIILRDPITNKVVQINEQDYGTISILRPETLTDEDWPKWLIIMDRNLWAKSNNTGDESSVWYHYQWWNNYGFPWNWPTSDVDQSNSQIEWKIEYDKSNFVSPVFIKTDEYDYWNDWNHNWLWWGDLDGVDNNWWAKQRNSLDRQWPCPKWFHVPSAWEWWLLQKYRAIKNWKSYTWENWLFYLKSSEAWGADFLNDFKLPHTFPYKILWYWSTWLYNFFYWTSSPLNDADGKSYHLRWNFGSKYWAPIFTNWNRSDWYTVRCFANPEEVYYVIIDSNWWTEVQSQLIMSWDLVSIPENFKFSKHNFVWWYADEELTQEFDIATPITGDISLYAKWECADWYESKWDKCVKIVNGKSATLLGWRDFNMKIKSLASLANWWSSVYSEYSTDNYITKIESTHNIPEAVRTWRIWSWIISTNDSDYPIYAWYDGWVLYYYTEAGTIFMNENSSYMFGYLAKMTSLDIDNWDASDVINMSYMFQSSNNLVSLDLSKWDTSSVANMSYMFAGCSKLENLDVSKWNVSKVTSMYQMFYNCNKLASLDVSKWNTSSVTNMGYMFEYCSNLTSLDVSDWNTSNVTSMTYMFYGCNKLENLDVSKWNTTNVTNMGSVFNWCSKLESLDVSKWNTTNVTNMDSVFNWCSSLASLDVSKWNTSKVTSMASMFNWCSKLESLDVSKWDTSNVISMASMFNWCSKLESLDVSKWNTSKVTSMSTMFWWCSGLTSLDLSKWNTSKVTSMSTMFWWCSSLTGLVLDWWDLRKWNGSNIIGGMFWWASALKKVSMRWWKIPSTFTNAIWWRTSSLSADLDELDVTDWGLGMTTDLQWLFANSKVKVIKWLDTWDTSSVTNMYQMFQFAENVTELDLSAFDTSSVTNMGNMFHNCTKLTWLDLSTFDTSNVTNMDGMFLNDDKLKTIYVSGRFRTNKVTSSVSMFYNATGIVGWNGTMYNSSFLDKTYARIDKSWVPWYFTNSWEYIATLLTWKQFNAQIKTLATWSSVDYQASDEFIKKIVRYTWNSIPANVQTWIISTTDSQVPVYAWFDESNWTLYYYSTARTIDMNSDSSYMFAFLTKLEEIDLGWIETNSVTDMSFMFAGGSSLTWLDLSNFNTSSVTNMGVMFSNCVKLETLNLDWWDLRKCSVWWWFFANTPKLKKISMKWWKIPSSFSDWIYRSRSASSSPIEEIDVTDWDLSITTNISWLFWSNWSTANKLTKIKWLDTWDTSNITNMSNMFNWLSWLKWLDLSNWNTMNVTSSYGMFRGCSWLESLNLSNWDMSKNTSSSDMFNGCTSLTWLILDWWDFTRSNYSYNAWLSSMLGWSSVKKISARWWKIPRYFNNWIWKTSASILEEIDVTDWDLSITADIHYLFSDLNNLKTIKWLETWNTSKVTDMSYMFYNCSKLENLDVRALDTSNVTSMSSMFYNCSKLKNLDVSKWNTSNVTNMSSLFKYCESLVSVEMDRWNTNKVTDFSDMFRWMTSLKMLDLSSFDTDQVSNMTNMFLNDSSLETIYVSDKFILSWAIEWGMVKMSSWDMFSWVVNILWWNGTTYNSEHVNGVYAKIDSETQSWYFTNVLDRVFTISYDLDGWVLPWVNRTGYTMRDTFTLLNPTKEWYTFLWWTLNGQATPQVNVEIIQWTRWNLEFTANWQKSEEPSWGSSSWWGKRVPSSDQDHGAADDKKTDDKKSEDVTDDTYKPDSQQKDVLDNDENKSDKSDISDNIELQADTPSETQVQYTNEQKESYSFAKSNWITTTSSIKEAKMNTSLKRIEMAKMLSYYAINVLWQEPDTSKWIVKFNDVSNKMDKQYDNWVTLSYQLWIMWQNMPKNNFRPNDEVTRAEFVTALSRMIYNTQDWKWKVKYYEPHMAKLYNEWIISNTNPKMKEKRWYVMTMLMRSAK